MKLLVPKIQKIKIKASDKYVIAISIVEEDETIRSNLYLRQIPDSELQDFLTKHGNELTYKVSPRIKIRIFLIFLFFFL